MDQFSPKNQIGQLECLIQGHKEIIKNMQTHLELLEGYLEKAKEDYKNENKSGGSGDVS